MEAGVSAIVRDEARHHQRGERVTRKCPGAGGAGGKGKRQKGDDGAASTVGLPVQNDS